MNRAGFAHAKVVDHVQLTTASSLLHTHTHTHTNIFSFYIYISIKERCSNFRVRVHTIDLTSTMMESKAALPSASFWVSKAIFSLNLRGPFDILQVW